MVREAAAGRTERLTMISSRPLPLGWTGKMWALFQGVEQATEFAPDYFLFTDADIVHAADSISSVVAVAQSRNLDLVSMMVKLHCCSLAERALIPAFVFFFFMLYPPRWINNPRRRTAAAAGGDILVRAEALAKIGGLGTIRNELIDDCALAREIKRTGDSIWLGLTAKTCSIRSYAGLSGIGRMISRTAFYHLRTLNLVIDRNGSRIGDNLPGATVSSLRWRLGNSLGRASLALDEHYILANGAVLFAFPAVGTSVAVGHTVLHGCDNPLGSAVLGRPRR